MGNFIGAVIGKTIGGLILLFIWFLKMHLRYPFQFAAVYVVGASISLIVDGNVLAAIIFAGLYALIVWKSWARYQAFTLRRLFSRILADTMQATLWKDLKPRHYVSFEFISQEIIRVRFSTPSGKVDDDVVKVLPAFRSALRLVDTIVVPDDDPFDGKVTVLFCRVSPLDTVLDASKAPVLSSPEIVDDPYHWLPVGLDAAGSPMELPLFLKDGGSVRQMVAGASGSGKSSIARQQLIQAVSCRYIDVVLMDGKGSEFTPYEPYVQYYGTSTADFWVQLRYLEEECKRRAAVLRVNTMKDTDRFATSWNHVDDGNFLLWFWDELGTTMAKFENSERYECMSRLYGVLSIARSLGIAVIFSSQTFKADILTTQIRDNCFDTSIGFKMNSAQEAAYIGFDATDAIRPDLIKDVMTKRGSYKKAGTFAFQGIGEPTYGRSYYLNAPQVKQALKRAPKISRLTVESTNKQESR